MIVTVTLNAAIDKTCRVDGFQTGEVHRASTVTALPGGKGLNVARTIRRLGGEVTAAGFVAGASGCLIVDGCRREGIGAAFVETEGESRTCLCIVDEASGVVTEVLEPGPVIAADAWERLVARVRELAGQATHVVISGSLPQGVPQDACAQLIAAVREAGALALLDTSGQALAHGLAARPFLAKPNRAEAEALLGRPLDTEEARRDALQELAARGAERVLLSLGADGAMLYDGATIHRLPGLPVRAVHPVGSGDALLGGLVWRLSQGSDLLDAAFYGMACGAANAMVWGAGMVEPEQVEGLYREAVRLAGRT